MRNMFWVLLFGAGMGLLCVVVGAILTERDKRRCRREVMEELTDCSLTDEEADEIAYLERKYNCSFGFGIVVLQQLRWLVQHDMSPEWDMQEEKK